MKKLTAVVLTVIATLLTAASSAASEAHSKSYEIESIELQIPSLPGIQIPATAVTPIGKQHERFPLVVIHHGHGGGRNENGGLARVADALAAAGIASIRFDFAGAGDSTEPFTKLSYTSMLADSNAALVWAIRNMPVDKRRIGGFGYSEGSALRRHAGRTAIHSIQGGCTARPGRAYRDVFDSFFGGNFDAYYAEAQANGYAVVTTPFGQVQNTSLEWFQETIVADPAADIAYFEGRVELIWGENEQIIPFSQVEALQAATANAANGQATTVTIPNADPTVTASTRISQTSTQRFIRRWCSSS